MIKKYYILAVFSLVLFTPDNLMISSLSSQQAPLQQAPLQQAPLQWGVFVSDDDLAGFEQMVGKQAGMQATFIGWGEDFPTSTASILASANQTMVIFWEQYGVTLDYISAGHADPYIQRFAAAARASGANIILAPLHEMNGNWEPWDGGYQNNSPAQVVAAWKRIHDDFGESANVKFAWDVNNVSEPDTEANAIGLYYPGDAYVDYVAVDGFNFENQTWNQVFPEALMAQLASYNKPVYILSTATIPGPQKAQWIIDMGAGIKKYPSIVGWIWFNQNGADGNWLVNTDAASLSAFKSILP